MKSYFLPLCLPSSILVSCIATISLVSAQIVPDNTVNTSWNGNLITGGITAGNNLFHSFTQFSISGGITAHFDNPLTIQNIIARITGNTISNINGIIQTNGNANLFLINPNGIVFGTDATLNIGGAFLATTGNALQFSNQGAFGTTTGNDVTLLTVNPSAILYNQIGAIQPITNQANLTVPSGASLLLLGGNVNFNTGTLFAPGGRIELAGLSKQGNIGLNVVDKNLSLTFADNLSLADVNLTNNSTVNVRAGGAGSIVVNAQNLNMSTLSNQNGLLAGIASGMGASTAVAGDINIQVKGTVTLTKTSYIDNRVIGTGKGGNTNINAGGIFLHNASQFSAVTIGKGDAGSVKINANNVVFDGTRGAFSTVNSTGIGNSGGIDITAQSFVLSNSAQVSSATTGKGDGGNISIRADTIAFDGISGIFSTVNSTGVGNSGGINVVARSLTLTNQAEIVASTFGKGNAGSIIINADTIAFDGINTINNNTNLSNGVFSTVQKGSVGNAGDVNLTARLMSLSNGARISVATVAQGNAGSLFVNVQDTINISGVSAKGELSGLFANTDSQSSGSSGNILINTTNLNIFDLGTIAVNSQGSGNGGSLQLRAKTFTLDNHAFLSAQTAAGEGGNIDIKTDSLLLMRHNSEISATAGGSGNGGNININSPFLVAVFSENSDITANAIKGRGGNIKINTYGIFGTQFNATLTPQSNITASSDFGVNGSVQINTPGIDPSKGLNQLSSIPVDVSQLVTQACSSKINAQFVVTGRGGLPTNPEEILGDETILTNLDIPVQTHLTSQVKHHIHAQVIPSQGKTAHIPSQSSMIEAQGWILNSKGQVILTAAVVKVSPQAHRQNIYQCLKNS